MEDLVSAGKSMGACSYYGAKSLAETAEVVFAPYNYLVDPLIRKSSGIDLENSILIIDEAHNIESFATDAGSIEINELELLPALNDLKAFVFAAKSETDLLQSIIKPFINWIAAHSRDVLHQKGSDIMMKLWRGEDAIQMLIESGFQADKIEKQLEQLEYVSNLETPAQIKLKVRTKTLLSSILMVADFIFLKGLAAEYRMVLSRTTSDRYQNEYSSGLQLSFWCLNPAVIFKEIGKLCNSLILASGTLSPLSSYQMELGLPFSETAEAKHVIKPHQIFARVVETGPANDKLVGTYANYQHDHYKDQIGWSILRFAAKIPSGVLVFLPSYKNLGLLIERWQASGMWTEMNKIKELFQEPKTNESGSVDKMMVKYSAACEGRGGLMFAVYRGKLSEGMDFSDEKARGVICVGIPYPNKMDPKLAEKYEYHNEWSASKGIEKGDTWYQGLAFRAINQALGRCIRHKNDWGVIILLDARFSEPKNSNSKEELINSQGIASLDERIFSWRPFISRDRVSPFNFLGCSSRQTANHWYFLSCGWVRFIL